MKWVAFSSKHDSHFLFLLLIARLSKFGEILSVVLFSVKIILRRTHSKVQITYLLLAGSRLRAGHFLLFAISSHHHSVEPSHKPAEKYSGQDEKQ